ncbi:Bug family tripartite tricarboxylate transporter substrate binding protein [Caenimonas terrae]|uniref:Bug family tripartite tricarboxylate transporter substrate binding protein n=1 Tax=Caenimonas terrae TaxID=696074 RepID=A0ABW0NC63_9BURK
MRLTSSLKTGFLALALALACGLAMADGYPSRPIKFVVPWPAGGATDQVARILAQPLSQAMGVPVVVENKGGAGGNIGTQSFVHDSPDGYSILLATSSTNAAGPHLFARQGFDPAKDFTPVTLLVSIPNVMVVPAKSPWHSIKDIVAAARANPNKYTYGSAGIGSSQHLAGAQFKKSAAIDIVHVPYKGSGPAAADLMAGHIDMMIDTGSLGSIKGGSLRALAVASETRLDVLPDVPTFKEAGVPMIASAWYGVMLPANAPADVVARLSREFNTLLKNPEIRARLQAIGAEIGGGSSDSFARFSLSEIKRYEAIVRDSGAPKE